MWVIGLSMGGTYTKQKPTANGNRFNRIEMPLPQATTSEPTVLSPKAVESARKTILPLKCYICNTLRDFGSISKGAQLSGFRG